MSRFTATHLGHLGHLDLGLSSRHDGGEAEEARRTGALADGQLVLVHDRIATLVQRVRVLHLLVS